VRQGRETAASDPSDKHTSCSHRGATLRAVAKERSSNRIRIVQGDVTTQAADAIVNAANSSLLGGGGVDGAIHRAGGPAILEECRLLGGCKTGEAKATTAGELPARHVIHTVGPVWRGGGDGEDELLASCHRAALAVASELGCRTVAFPAVSTGVYGFPVERAARIALGVTAEELERRPEIEHVTFVLHGADAFAAFDEAERELTGAGR
jgi:O-acetyl-ADP-ribose deacetylase